MNRVKNILGVLFLVTIVVSCSDKLKIYNIHKSRDNIKGKKNFYLKDKNRSFERLKGKWIWAENRDTLVLNIKPDYKKAFVGHIYKNAYYDSSIINVKYVKEGMVVYNDLDKELTESCLYASPFQIQTNIFYLSNSCLNIFGGSYLTFLNDDNSLSLLSPSNTDKKTFLIKDGSGDYKIEVPNSIVFNRVIETVVE